MTKKAKADTILQLTALKKVLELIAQNLSGHFGFFTDSFSALEAIQSRDFNHPIVVDIRVDYFNLLTINKHVVLAWVPSHMGIPGN